MLSQSELKDFLDSKSNQFNHPDFITDDPIQIPHQFSKKEDIEISGFLAATIAWGQRKTIINNANKIMDIMGHEPHSFVLNAGLKEVLELEKFKHRTFNGIDLQFFIGSLRNMYLFHNGLEGAFSGQKNAFNAINQFRNIMLSVDHEKRSEKHVSSPKKGSASKRINMFLRWMTRKDQAGVDFGIWNVLPMSELMIPLDVHTGNMARKLNLIQRKQNDWKALEELMSVLRKLDPKDPAKYDFALFGLGVNEDF
ncbi:MAG: TIGR02757 family protein [Salibacteraceae bacterium]